MDFLRSISCICGVIVHVCRLFPVSMTTTAFPLHFPLPECVLTAKMFYSRQKGNFLALHRESIINCLWSDCTYYSIYSWDSTHIAIWIKTPIGGLTPEPPPDHQRQSLHCISCNLFFLHFWCYSLPAQVILCITECGY